MAPFSAGFGMQPAYDVLLVADAVTDICVYPSNPAEFSRLNGLRREGASIAEVITYAQDHNMPVYRTPAGPLLNLAAPLALSRAMGDVPIRELAGLFTIGVSPDGFPTERSKAYLDVLRNLGINARSRSRTGDLAQCLYIVHPTRRKELPRIWESNIAEIGDYQVPRDFVSRFDVLAFSVTLPTVMRRALQHSRAQLVAYNPGPVFLNMDFEETGFTEFIEDVHLLTLNKDEAGKVMKSLGYIGSGKITNRQVRRVGRLFEDFPTSNLEWIMVTLGATGSVIFSREGRSSVVSNSVHLRDSPWKVDPKDPRLADTIGCGDNHYAGALEAILKAKGTPNPAKIVVSASQKSQEALLHRGGVSPQAFESLPSLQQHVVREEVPRAANGNGA